MHLTDDELKAHLIQTDENFRRLAEQHSRYKQRLQELAARPYLSPHEQVEETQLKKLKLRLKDQMQQIMDRYRTRQPA